MGYQFIDSLNVPDTDQITISLWFKSTNISSGFPLLEFGPQPPYCSIHIEMSGSLGLAEAGGSCNPPNGQAHNNLLVGNPVIATISGVGPNVGNSGHFYGPPPYTAVVETMNPPPHWGIKNGDGYMPHNPSDEGTHGWEFNGPDNTGMSFAPADGGGTPWTSPYLVFDTGDVDVQGFHHDDGLYLLTGGSKMPSQPSALVVSGSALWFVGCGRYGVGDPSSTISNVEGFAMNKKVLRPAGPGLNYSGWNHVFVNWDGTKGGWSIWVNNQDNSDHGNDNSGQYGVWSNGNKMAVDGLPFGLPIIPDQAGGLWSEAAYGGNSIWQTPYHENAVVNMAYVQVWLDQYIDPGGDFQNFFTIVNEGRNLVPPADPWAAQNAYGPSQIFFYRNKLLGVPWKNYGTAGDFTTVGKPPADYYPGPGQVLGLSTTAPMLEDIVAENRAYSRNVSRAPMPGGLRVPRYETLADLQKYPPRQIIKPARHSLATLNRMGPRMPAYADEIAAPIARK